MTFSERLVWAIVIVAADFLVFALPLTAIFFAYVLVQRPVWFREWMLKVYEN